MSAASQVTTDRVTDLVLANRVIRAPFYDSAHDESVEFSDLDRGLQWGADVVPALLGLFRIEDDSREDRPDGWVGFARHWRGATMRIEFDRFTDHEASEPVLVVTAVYSREGAESIHVEEFGDIEVPDQPPTEEEWTEREKQYQSARRKDSSDGSTALNAFIASLPGWKRERAATFDDLIEREVPDVRRAVRYHQPFWGVEDRGWFASFAALTNHVKLTFVCESDLDPRPPSGTGPQRQALDLREDDSLDEEQVADWIRQAAADPGMNW